jgi:Spy/CpxP family protein refolding chaperone
MNASWKRAAAAGALCLGLAAAIPAIAQPPGPGGPPSAGRGPDQRRMRFEQMRQRREQRLHDILQIRPDQEGAFHAYVQALAPPARSGQSRPGPGPAGAPQAPMTTPERLDRMAARMAERQQRFQQTAAATRAFYGALSPEQRKAFDDLGAMGEHGGEHGAGPGRSGPGGGRGFEGPPR